MTPEHPERFKRSIEDGTWRKWTLDDLEETDDEEEDEVRGEMKEYIYGQNHVFCYECGVHNHQFNMIEQFYDGDEHPFCQKCVNNVER